jgi:hypothetical protein
MIKHLITATVFVLGGAGVALVAYLAAEPLAFTHSVRERPAVVAAYGSPTMIPANLPVDLDTETNAISLAEIQITAAPRRATKRSVGPVVHTRLDRCSDWRDVGASFVDPADGTSVRNVRALCARPDIDR